MDNVMKRARILGVVLAVAGISMAGAGLAYGLPMANDGLDSAQAMYASQGVKLSYNENGELVDRGTTEGAQKILALLEDEWRYPVNDASFDPNDPVINTRDELMYQYATITYHVLHGEVAVKLTAQDLEKGPIVYRGVTYAEPGEYRLAPEKYYAQLDRTNPIERQLRDAWTPQALALTGALAGGHANQAAGELAQATSLAVAGTGALFALAGAGLVWVSFGREAPSGEKAKARAAAPAKPVVK